jgi:hypothetical protein
MSVVHLSIVTMRRQANWRLDPALRRACKPDVAEMCKVEDSRGTETGEVYSCLIHNHDDLDPGCMKELGRAVHMAFFIWSQGAVLTAPCDEDVAALCLKKRPNMDAVPGAVGSCLADIVSGVLGGSDRASGRGGHQLAGEGECPGGGQFQAECRRGGGQLAGDGECRGGGAGS